MIMSERVTNLVITEELEEKLDDLYHRIRDLQEATRYIREEYDDLWYWIYMSDRCVSSANLNYKSLLLLRENISTLDDIKGEMLSVIDDMKDIQKKYLEGKDQCH